MRFATQACSGRGTPPGLASELLVDAILDYWSQLPRHHDEARRSAGRIAGRPGRTFGQWAGERLDAFR